MRLTDDEIEKMVTEAWMYHSPQLGLKYELERLQDIGKLIRDRTEEDCREQLDKIMQSQSFIIPSKGENI